MAITSSCGVVEPWAAVIIGVVAGLLYLFGTWALIKVRLDDAVNAIPVHMVNGLWGMIAVGLFAAPKRLELTYAREIEHVGLFYSFRQGSGDANLLAAQIVGCLFVAGWVMGVMLPFFIWLDWRGWFRADPLEEIVGLDTSYHGGLILSSEDDVNPEYISEFRKKRSTLRNRKQSANKFGSDGSFSTDAVEESGVEEQSS